MSENFEELDYRPTPMGELSLRRRWRPAVRYRSLRGQARRRVPHVEPVHGRPRSLSPLGLAALPRAELDVVVGGLGLGYTARRCSSKPRVRSLIVVDALGEVIEWHERGLVPLGRASPGIRGAGSSTVTSSRCRRPVGASIGRAGPPVPRGARRHRSLAAERAAPAPRPVLRAGRAAPARRASASRRRVRAVVQ